MFFLSLAFHSNTMGFFHGYSCAPKTSNDTLCRDLDVLLGVPRMLEKKVCLSLNIGLRFLQNGPSTGKFEQNRLRDAVLPD